MKKRVISAILVSAILAGSLMGCGQNKAAPDASNSSSSSATIEKEADPAASASTDNVDTASAEAAGEFDPHTICDGVRHQFRRLCGGNLPRGHYVHRHRPDGGGQEHRFQLWSDHVVYCSAPGFQECTSGAGQRVYCAPERDFHIRIHRPAGSDKGR